MGAVLAWPQRPDTPRRHGSLLVALGLHAGMIVAALHGLHSSSQPAAPHEVVITLLSQDSSAMPAATRPLTAAAPRPSSLPTPVMTPTSAQAPAIPVPPLLQQTTSALPPMPPMPPVVQDTAATVVPPAISAGSVASPAAETRTTTPPASVSATPPAAPASMSAAARVPRTVSGVEYLSPPAVDYPISARRAGIEGKVTLRLLIDEKGLPQRADIQQSSGHARLDEAARTAVLRAQFKPHLEDGQPMPVHALVPINFTLR